MESKYDEDFCWFKEDSEKSSFVAEAYREITQEHPLYAMKLTCIAKCETNDDVLFLTEYGQFIYVPEENTNDQ